MNVTLDLTPEKYDRLAELARAGGLPVEEWLGREVDALLDRNAAFEAAAKYVLDKNAELYRRLAK